MIIGYAGNKGSEIEKIVQQEYPNEIKMPLLTSENVIKALKDKYIDIGIMEGIYNNKEIKQINIIDKTKYNIYMLYN